MKDFSLDLVTISLFSAFKQSISSHEATLKCKQTIMYNSCP